MFFSKSINMNQYEVILQQKQGNFCSWVAPCFIYFSLTSHYFCSSIITIKTYFRSERFQWEDQSIYQSKNIMLPQEYIKAFIYNHSFTYFLSPFQNKSLIYHIFFTHSKMNRTTTHSPKFWSWQVGCSFYSETSPVSAFLPQLYTVYKLWQLDRPWNNLAKGSSTSFPSLESSTGENTFYVRWLENTTVKY